MNLNELTYEQKIISDAKKAGFKYVSSEKIFTMRRGNFLEIILEDELIAFLNNNNNLSADMIGQVVRKIKDLKGSDLIQGNMQFQKFIVEGIKIFDKKRKKYITVEILKKENNRLLVTNQFVMKSSHPTYKTQRPDIVLYINGLPISVIELKSPKNEFDDILERAYNQIEDYKLHISPLFIYNLFTIISDGHISKMGSLTSSFSRYQNWRGSKFDSPASTIFKDVFKEKILIDLAKNFTFFGEGLEKQKIVAGYHQYYGVKSAIRNANEAMNKDKKIGIFWHTQGSGKSFSMIFFAKNFSKIKPGTTFIVVSDRNNLDNQLFNNFKTAELFLGQKVEQIESISNLKIKLKDRKQDGVYLSTIQKFTKDVGELIKRDNVVVISDEAHRSHNNLQGKFEIDILSKTYSKKFGNAKYLRKAFPNASFIGFTGTPIENEDKSTTRIFGKVISEYKMNDAERDGVIVPLVYESRMAKLFFDKKTLDELDEQDQKISDNLNKNSFLPTEVKRKMNKNLKKLNNFVSDIDRIKGIVDDFIKHYETRKNIVKGKVMFVVLNRKVANDYYNCIIDKKPEWKDKVKVIITNNGYKDPLYKLSGTSSDRKVLALEFKNPNSKFKIAIVVDMWLTGFDVPSLDTLYLDKPVKMHNLMQTIARANRVYTNKEEGIVKETGLIVDYIGISDKLQKALKFYLDSYNSQNVINNHDLNKVKEEYLKFLNKIWNNFNINSLNISIEKANSDISYAFNVIEKVSNLILENKVQNDFVEAAKLLSKYLKIAISVFSIEERTKFQILISARLRLVKLAMDEINFKKINEKMLLKLEDAIKYEKTIVIDNLDNQRIKLSEIFSFIEKPIKNNENLSAREKIIATKLLCKHVAKVNLIRASKLSDDLNKLMNRYESSHITLEELLNGLIIISKNGKKIIKNDENDGFSIEERAFFDILLEPIKQTNYDKEKIKIILKDLLVIINNDKLVNKQWAFNATLVKKTRGHLKNLFRKHKYPKKEAEIARKGIINQIMKLKRMEQSE